jgi:putative DNA primase/helicase
MNSPPPFNRSAVAHSPQGQPSAGRGGGHAVSARLDPEDLPRAAAEVFELRKTYWRHGYRPVPIYTRQKRPRGDGWRQDALQDPPVWAERYPEDEALSTGIATGTIVAVDIDVLIQAVVDRIVYDIEQDLGRTPLVRIGLAPKTLLAFRCEEPFRKQSTGLFIMPDGSEAKVEILAEGQQFVADGIHPDTGEPYIWLGRGTPETVPLADLPAITFGRAHAIVTKAREILIANGGVEKRPLPPALRDKPTAADSFFAKVNEAALRSLGSWVKALFPKAVYQPGTGAWRVASKDRGRPDLQEDTSIHPDGIRDWGLERPLTPIDLVIEHGNAADAVAAALWLCERLGIASEQLGWHPHRADDPAYIADLIREAAERAGRGRKQSIGSGDTAPPQARGWRLVGADEIFPPGCHFRLDMSGQRWVFEPLGTGPAPDDPPPPDSPAQDPEIAAAIKRFREWNLDDDAIIAKLREGFGLDTADAERLTKSGAGAANPRGVDPSPEPEPQPSPTEGDEPPPRQHELDDFVLPLEYSENNLSYRFSARFQDVLVFVHGWGRWLRWRGGLWSEDFAVRVYDEARKICAAEGQRALATMANKKTAAKIAAAINKAACVAAIERLARHHEPQVRPLALFDADRLLLNAPSHSLPLPRDATTTIQPREHHKEDYCTKTTTVNADFNANCPLWKRFLLRIMANDQEMVDYLQRLCGYCLTGLVEEHTVVFFHGKGRNGKTTLADVLLGILGTGPTGYAAVSPISTFVASQTDQHPTDLAMLQSKRLTIANETERGRAWATSKIKMMTGGDLISARFMRQDFFTYSPQFKVIILGNNKPVFHNVDVAMRERMHLVPFNVVIPKAERDKQLPEKLKAEYPAILAWMVRGYEQWRAKGLAPPQKVVDATETYFATEDNVSNWIADCCVLDPDGYATLKDLFASWKAWCANNGIRDPGASKELAKALDAREELTRKENRDHQIGWMGIRILSAQETLI